MIIIAASGMLTGGRVLHHLKAFAGDPKNILLLAGFQSAGTRGWRILNGEKEVKVHGMMLPIECQVVPSDSFSAHADRSELLNWLSLAPQKPQQVFLVHGEPSAAEDFKALIENKLQWPVTIAEMNHIQGL